jgi:MSHA biogenesis protein MshM
MYFEFFGLTEPPFRITPDTEFFYSGAQRGDMLEALVYAVNSGEGLIKVTGEVGAGKTMLSRMLVERLPPEVETVYLAIPTLARDEVLHAIATDLGLRPRGLRTTALTQVLQERLIALHKEHRRVVVIIDEAHAVPRETLEEIRLLSNLETGKHKLLQIVLFGQPELDAMLERRHLRQLKERITHSFSLDALEPKEVGKYLEFRLRKAGYRGPRLFNAACLALISKASLGLTRRINIIADKALLAAFAANTHSIEPRHVKAAIEDSEFFMGLRPPRIRAMAIGAAAGLAVGILFGAGMTWMIMSSPARQRPPAAASPARTPAAPLQSPSAEATVRATP